MPHEERFSKADVDYLVKEPKLIRFVPEIGSLGIAPLKGWRLHSSIFRKSDPTKPIKGLVVIAKAHQAPPGIPDPTPSAALEWYGHRIRGINYELRHDNPDGTSVRGWHEHIWSPRFEDHLVVEARPGPRDRSLLGIFKWGLAKWNIEVQRKQEDIE